MAKNNRNDKSLESWIWDAACSIRGAADVPKYKDFILPLVFAKRLCDVFDDEVDRIDYNATTHGQRDIDDDRLSNLIEKISEKRLGLTDVEPDIIGRIYEYLIRKFAEDSGQSAGEFYTPAEVGMVMAKIIDSDPGMTIYDPCCGSAGLLIKSELMMEEKMVLRSKKKYAPLQLFGQEYIANTWAMANMNMIIHYMEGKIEIGDTFRSPKFRERGKFSTFDRVVANLMWNQNWYIEQDYDNDKLGRFPQSAGFPGKQSRLGMGAAHGHRDSCQ